MFYLRICGLRNKWSWFEWFLKLTFLCRIAAFLQNCFEKQKRNVLLISSNYLKLLSHSHLTNSNRRTILNGPKFLMFGFQRILSWLGEFFLKAERPFLTPKLFSPIAKIKKSFEDRYSQNISKLSRFLTDALPGL